MFPALYCCPSLVSREWGDGPNGLKNFATHCIMKNTHKHIGSELSAVDVYKIENLNQKKRISDFKSISQNM